MGNDGPIDNDTNEPEVPLNVALNYKATSLICRTNVDSHTITIETLSLSALKELESKIRSN